MGKLSVAAKGALGLTLALVLVQGGFFLGRQSQAQPWLVTVQRQDEAGPAPSPGVDETTPESLLPGEQINLNKATAAELQRLPGIGEKRAEAIVQYRQEHGPFQGVQDLLAVSGIGEGILAGLSDYVTTG